MRRALSLVVLAGLLTGCTNFDVVADGKVYRSAQLTPTELDEAIEARGIASVLNLRGASPGKPWYDDELAKCARRGVVHVSIKLKASRHPTREELLALLDAMETLPRPMLIHCQGGADRTGLACAVYRVAIEERPVEVAARELSVYYFHLGRVAGTEAMDEVLELFAETSRGKSFRHWVEDGSYDRALFGLRGDPTGASVPAPSARKDDPTRRRRTVALHGVGGLLDVRLT